MERGGRGTAALPWRRIELSIIRRPLSWAGLRRHCSDYGGDDVQFTSRVTAPVFARRR